MLTFAIFSETKFDRIHRALGHEVEQATDKGRKGQEVRAVVKHEHSHSHNCVNARHARHANVRHKIALRKILTKNRIKLLK